MASQKSKGIDGGKIATAWLSNEAVIYALLGLAGVVGVYFLIKYGRIWFSDLVDKILAFFQGYAPKPKSQSQSERTAVDAVSGLVYANKGDRAASDAWDWFTGGLPAAIDSYSSPLSGSTEDQIAWEKAQGYMDANGNLTAKGIEAAKAGLLVGSTN